jgi:hypothetical protein
MALNKAQLLTTPGPLNPGVIGAVKNGPNTTITNGVLNATGGGVGKIVAGTNIQVSPTDGEGIVTVSATSLAASPLQAGGEDDFPAGTVMSFCQPNAPARWTKNTSLNDGTLRVVSGSGGGTGGSTGFSSALVSYSIGGVCTASYTFSGTTSSVSLTPSGSASITSSTGQASLSQGQMGRHNHVLQNIQYNIGGNRGSARNTGAGYGYGVQVLGMPFGNNEGHSHGFSGTATLTNAQSTSHSHNYNRGATAQGTLSNGGTINLAVKYVDFILCTKN